MHANKYNNFIRPSTCATSRVFGDNIPLACKTIGFGKRRLNILLKLVIRRTLE